MNKLEVCITYIKEPCFLLHKQQSYSPNKMRSEQKNHSFYTLKLLKLQINTSPFDSFVFKGPKSKGISIMTYLKLQKINNLIKNQEQPHSKRKNTEQSTPKFNKKPLRKLTQPNPDGYKNTEKTTYLTEAPQQSRPERSQTCYQDEPEYMTTIMKNSFPQRRAKKNKDSRWCSYLYSNAFKTVQQISLKIETKEEKQVRMKSRYKQSKNVNVPRSFTANLQKKRSVQYNRMNSMRRLNQDISPWITSTNDGQKSTRRLD